MDTYYEAVLDGLYAERPGLEHASYAEQHAEIMGLHFGTSDAYSVHLGDHGWRGKELVANCRPLQLRWMRERGKRTQAITRRGRRWPGRAGGAARAVLREQIAALDAEVVYVQDFGALTEDDVRALKQEGRFMVGQLGSASRWERVELYDLIVTSFPHLVERLQERGIDCEYLPLAFDDRVLEVCSPGERDIPLAFVGGVHAPDVHRGGTAMLERLCAELDMQMWGYVADTLGESSPIRPAHHGEAWGLDMYSVLARARVVINRHGDIAEDWANNMRLFEATGMGTCLLTEAARNLPGLFDPGTEVITYEGTEDLVAKARALTADPERGARIGAAGHRRTLRDHTYARRMAELSAMMRSRLEGRS